MDFYNIPIFIISYNRTETLRLCVERFMQDGYKNIIILDNASTNKEHLKYLKSLPCKVCFLEKNYKSRVLWECGLFKEIIDKEYYVLTDPDVLPIKQCPTNYVEEFFQILQQYPEKTKAGFSLKLDDLPEDYIFKYDIIRFESFYWENRLPYKFTIYDAPIDTTFALYRPMQEGWDYKKQFYNGIRTGGQYIARHLGWYPNQYNQKWYYNDPELKESTSLCQEAIQGFQLQVISQIANKQGMDIFSLLKKICTTDFIRTHSSWASILYSIAYILAKKIKVSIKTR